MNRQAPHPLVVLGVAILLPGGGQVLNRHPRRGLVFVFYTMLLGVLTYQVAPPQASMIGHVAGGVFVYAVSILDAYKVAVQRRRWLGPAARPDGEPLRGSPVSGMAALRRHLRFD